MNEEVKKSTNPDEETERVNNPAELAPYRDAHAFAFLAMQDSLGIATDHIAEGGTLSGLAETWGIPYSKLRKFFKSNPDAWAAIQDAMSARKEFIQEKVLDELQAIARSDVTKAYDDDGALLPVSSWPDDVRRSVVSIETDELFDGFGKDREKVGHTRKLKIESKLKANEMLGKVAAMWKEEKTSHLTVTLENILVESRKLPDPTEDVPIDADFHPVHHKESK